VLSAGHRTSTSYSADPYQSWRINLYNGVTEPISKGARLKGLAVRIAR
jgi:hypothetical protein